MRQSRMSLLDAIMPRVRRLVLGAILAQPTREWYRSELARHLGVPGSSLQRELRALLGAGILRARRAGNHVYFAVDPACPILPELRGLVAKTTGLGGVLRDVLRPLTPRIRFALVFGSIARGTELSLSDVDLLVVGGVTRRELLSPLRRAEDRLGRPVNAMVYTPEEFARKAGAGHHFVREVMEGDKLFVVGNADDMEETAQRGEGAGAQADQGRD